MEKPVLRQSTRIYGFDYLRAIACVFVVAFHISPLSMQMPFAKALHVFLFASAVPIFILISLFLTELKGLKKEYIVQKSRRLSKIYFMWGWIIPALIQLFFMNPFPNLNQENIHELVFNGPNWTLKVYGVYFLGFLFLLTWISFALNSKLDSYRKAFQAFIIFGMVNIFIPFLPDNFDLLRHSLIPFLIYIPLSKMVAIDYRENKNCFQRACIFLCAYIPIACIEAILIKSEGLSFLPLFHYSPYGRISIPLLATSVIYASFLIDKSLEQFSKTLVLLSECSLGIYLIHGFVLNFLYLVGLNVPMPIPFLIVLSISILITCLIKDIPYLKSTISL